MQVYDHQYKAVVDGMETDGVLEIDPAQRIEIFRVGNGSEEVLEIHDFKNVSKEWPHMTCVLQSIYVYKNKKLWWISTKLTKMVKQGARFKPVPAVKPLH